LYNFLATKTFLRTRATQKTATTRAAAATTTTTTTTTQQQHGLNQGHGFTDH